MNVKHALMRAHGSDPISYSTLQPGLSYFETSFGYVAFQRALGFELTLGPPVCAEGDRAEIRWRWTRDAAMGPGLVFRDLNAPVVLPVPVAVAET